MLSNSSSIFFCTRSWRNFTTISMPSRLDWSVWWFRSTFSWMLLQRAVSEFADEGREPLDTADSGLERPADAAERGLKVPSAPALCPPSAADWGLEVLSKGRVALESRRPPALADCGLALELQAVGAIAARASCASRIFALDTAALDIAALIHRVSRSTSLTRSMGCSATSGSSCCSAALERPALPPLAIISAAAFIAFPSSRIAMIPSRTFLWPPMTSWFPSALSSIAAILSFMLLD
mmetsp:Transcript_55385/g.99710  ORF Transcript_55385/g.99710 Transcript_55385/m.99710 type:complete len:238 (-) Transcript_55385:322-1035(-)